ncbi:MAG: hypothetical protein PW843_15035 [Azospirillaceae bacterium]|nr:hypothetical protein [Azospirillaceae bacterium]
MAQDDGVYLQFQRVGPVVKATAIDPVTGTEVSVQGPASTPQAALGRLAVSKLKYVLSKKT